MGILTWVSTAQVAFFVFFMPPRDAGNWYFFFGAFLYFVAFALIDIPMRAWASELTPD